MKRAIFWSAGAGAALALAITSCASEPVEHAPSAPSGDAAARAQLEALRSRFPAAPLRAAAATTPSRRLARVTLPATADGEVEIEDTASNVAARFRLEGVATVTRADVDDVSLYPGSGVVQRIHDAGVEDFVAFDARPAREEIRYVVDVSRAAGLRLVENSLELLDSHGAPRLRVEAPYLIEAAGAQKPARLTVEGCAYDTNPGAPWNRPVTPPGASSCTVRVSWSGVAYPALLDPAWTSAGTASGRDQHTAVKLTNGKVLLVYGNACGGGCLLAPGAFLWDPATRAFASTGGPSGRGVGAPGIGLANGKALVNGSSTLLYDPTTGVFTDAAPITCGGCAFTLLPSGKVLFTGDSSGLYNPDTDKVEPTGAMTASRSGAAATVLDSGKVLITGGGGLASAELYDPVANTFAASKAMMAVPRQGHFALKLQSGKVLVLGPDASAELYDPAKDAFSPTGSLLQARDGFDATVLESGKVLVVGGFIGVTATTSVERYEPSSGVFVTGPSLSTARGFHQVTLLDDGSVLATCGRSLNNNFGTSLNSAELLSFAAPGATCTADDTCNSGICDQGICCEAECTASCHACSAGTGACEVVTDAEDPDTCQGVNICNADGDCKKKLGETCKTGECSSGFCADGYCCDSACDETCQACDGLVHGTCAAVAGPPHGARACTGDASGTSVCAGACDGNAKHVKACLYPGDTTGCGTSCADAERTASSCDGKGACVEQPARACPGNFTCADDTTCSTSCTSDDDCIGGFACADGACTPTAKCDGDHTIRAADGKSTTDCAPFKCDAKNRCKISCKSVADCANPFVCDASGVCGAAPPNTISAGCALTRGSDDHTAASFAAFALFAFVNVARRRRRAAQNS